MATNLIIEDEEGATTIVPLENEAVTIGREEGNSIQLTEQNVSRYHARLYPTSNGWMIADVQSYNGIKINGVDIAEPSYVNEGDLIQIGDYRLALSAQVEYHTPSPITANDGNPTPQPEFESESLPVSLQEQSALPKATDISDDFAETNPAKRNYILLWIIFVLLALAVVAALFSGFFNESPIN